MIDITLSRLVADAIKNIPQSQDIATDEYIWCANSSGSHSIKSYKFSNIN